MSYDTNNLEFVIFDAETTGLNPQEGDRIVEIAGIRFRGLERISSFQSLINPGRPISQAAFEVNKITREMLKDAPKTEEVLPRFLSFIKGSCLCSYNAGFDLGFLNNELLLLKQPPLSGIMVLDILKMARRLLPGLERYALWFVADSLGIKKEQEHRALSDVEITLSVFRKLRHLMELKGISDFKHMSSLFSVNQDFLDNINAQKLSKIQEAIGLGVKLKIKYLSSSGAQVTEREVSPKKIRQEGSRFYLAGYCSLRKEERTFSVDGILHLEIL